MSAHNVYMTAWPWRDERAVFDRLGADRDGSAHAAVVEHFMPLARQLARRYINGREDLDDLEQVAAIGLVKAIDRFDATRGLAFSTYAFPTILGELRRHFRDHGWAVRVPRGIQERVGHVDRMSTELVGRLGRAPTVAELADHAEVTSEQVVEALQAAHAHYAASLDQLRPDGDRPVVVYDVAVEDAGYQAVDDAALLDDLMRVLSERDRLILRLRFREDLTQVEISEVVGISQMQISRLIRRAIEQLRMAANRPDQDIELSS